MNVNTSKRINFYTQGQPFAVRVVVIVCLFTSCTTDTSQSQRSRGGSSSHAHTSHNPTSAEANAGHQSNVTSQEVHIEAQQGNSGTRALAPDPSQASGGKEQESVVSRSLHLSLSQTSSTGQDQGSSSSLDTPLTPALNLLQAPGREQQGSSEIRSPALDSQTSGEEQQGGSSPLAASPAPASDSPQASGREEQGSSEIRSPALDSQTSGEEQQEGNSPTAASPAPAPNPHQGSGKNGVGGTGIGAAFRAITAGSSSSASVGDTQRINPDQDLGEHRPAAASSSFRAALPIIPDPPQAPVGEQQESHSALIQELQALAADPQIDQEPTQLARLGEVLLELAAFEQQAGAAATDRAPYTTAAILYQHVLCICAQKADTLGSQEAATLAQPAYQGLAQTQAVMLARAKGAAPKATTQADVDALKECISEDRRMLEAFRSDVKSRTINLIEHLEAALSNPKSSSEAIKQAEQTYIQGSQELLAEIATEIKFILAKFYQRAEAALGPAPCQYAVMGLGALALQQATPCADLEFAILMEDAPDEATAAAWTAYFRNISHLVHFFVINLGKTILPFSKYNVSLDHLGSKGLNFALDGKTPLGSKEKPYYDLIQPVEKMLHYLHNAGNTMEPMDRLLPCTLERTCHVYGDDKLHEAYQEKQQQLFKSQDKHAYEERMRKKLLEVGSTLPHSQLRVIKTDRGQADKLRTDGPGLHPEDACQLYDVRQELYRMPEVPYRLATYYGLCPESAWNAVEQLEEQQIIGVSEDAKHLAAHRLKYAVSFATMLRLANDMGCGEQSKAPAACTSREEAVSKFFSLPNTAFQENGSLFKYYRIALPLYREVKGMLHLRSQPQSDHDASSITPFRPGNKPTADPKKAYFNASSFYDTSYAVDIATHHRLLRPQQVIAWVDSHLERVKESANNGDLGRTYHNLGVTYYHVGAFDKSFEHFNCSLERLQKRYPKGDLQVATVLRSIGIAHYNVHEFSESLKYFKQSLEMLQGLYQENNPETPQLETAQALSSVGAAHEQLGNFQESLAYKQQAVAMLQALYPENSPEVARALLSLGDAYEATGQFPESEQHKEAALHMCRVLYRSPHPEVARALLSLGDAYAALKNFEVSLQHKQEALTMLQAWYPRDHPEVARAWFSLGETYEAMGQLEVKEKCKMLSKSRTCKTEAVDIFKRFYEDGHPECKQADDSLSSTKSVLLSLQPINSNHSDIPLPCTGRMNHTNPTNRTVYAQPFTLLSTPQQEVLDENTLLREYYQRSTFAYIPLLFAEHGCKHLQDLACQLMLREHKRVKEDAKQIGGSNEEGQGAFDHMGIKAVKTLIELQDLFKDRSIHPEKPVEDVKRILLTGDPGIGKTTLSKKMAYQWAEGEWGQEFNTLFWLPVRSLRQSWYDGTSYDRKDTLATAIANNCIDDGSATEAEYHRRCQYIEQELGKPTTLVILDGLNEREGASNKIIREAQDRNARHKLLMISRSAGMETAQQLADIEIEHAGFNLYQIQRYVQQEIPDSQQPEQLLGYLYKHANICSIAQVPVNLQLLCAFWRDESCKARKEELEKGSLARLYRSLTAYMWERFSKQHCQDNTLNTILLSECQEGYFISLSKIALSALEQGNVLIGDQQVQDLLGDAIRDMIQESGLLQAASNGHCQFPNLMFQEYFASCALAQQFMSKDEETKKEASELVANRKYESQYARVLSFMAGEVSITKGVQSIKHLLSLLGEREKEIRGLQHLLLQLRVIHEWLCVVVSQEEADQGMNELEKEFKVLSSLTYWFDTAFKYVRLEGYGPNSTGRSLITLLTDSLQTFRSIVAYIPGVFDLLQQAAQNDDNAIQEAALGPLSTLCAAAPEGWARKALSRAQEALESDNDRVRRSALKVLSTLVQASPGQAEQFLSIIQNTLKRDSAKHVRSTSLAVTSQLAETWTTQKSVPIMPEGSRKASIDCGQHSRSASAECLAPSLSQILPAAAKAKASSIIPKGLQDTSEDVRKVTLETLSTLIKASPSLAQEALPNIQTGLEDHYEHVREAALKALSSLIEASPDQAQGILENTKIVLQDASENIRKAAFGILSSLIEVSPKHVQEALPSIQTGLQDPSEDVRKAAFGALSALIRALPSLAQKALPSIQTGLQDPSEDVRKAAFGALSSLIEVSTEHAPEALENIQRGLQDTSEDVRKAALGVLPSLIEVSSALVPQALAIITQTVLHDASKHVRRAALGGLSSLINQYPEQVPKALQKLQEALQHGASDVCDTSLQVLFSLLKTSPSLQEQIFPILLAAFKVKYRRACRAAFQDLSSLIEQSPALSKEAFTFLEKVLNSLHTAFAGDAPEDLSNTLVNLKEQCGHTGLGTQGPSSAEASPGQGFLLLGEAAKDSVWHVREAALKALSLLIQTCPEQAQNAFPIIQEAAKDQSWCVRQAALEALHSLIKTSIENPKEALEIVLKALKDESSSVCRAACDALSTLLQQSPALAPEALPSMLEAAQDESCRIRQVAFNALSTLLQQSPALAANALPSILAGIKDRDATVRPAALEALFALIQVSPAQTEGALSGLQEAAQDNDADVRRVALKAISRLFQQSPGLTAEAFPRIEEVTKDSDLDAYPTARATLLSLLKKSPSQAQEVLQFLQKAVEDQYSAVRQAALEALSALIEASPALAPEALESILKALQDSNVDVRSLALEALSALIEASPELAPEALESILKALQDSNVDVRSLALEALPALIEASPALAPEALESILKALQDSNVDVRSAALEAFAGLLQAPPVHAQAASTNIQEATTASHSDVRPTARAILLSLLKESPAQAQAVFQGILKATEDREVDVCIAALEAFSGLLQESPALPQAASTNIQETTTASHSDVRPTARTILLSLLKESPAQAQAALESIIKALRNTDPNVCSTALVALSTLVQASPAQAPEALQCLKDALKDKHSAIRQAALEALPTLVEVATPQSTPSSSPILPRILSRTPSSSLASEALGSLQETLKDSALDVRKTALVVLSKLVKISPDLTQKVLPSLQKALEDSDPDVRTAALVALPKLVEASPKKAKEVFENLQKALEDSDPEVRTAALVALPKLVEASPKKAEAALQSIQKALKDSDPEVRSAALAVIATLIQQSSSLAPQALVSLQNALEDSDPDVRSAALAVIATLIQQSSSLAPQALVSLQNALQDSDLDVRTAALVALPKLVEASPKKAKEVFGSLQEVLQDSDPHVRSTALKALPTLAERSPDLAPEALPSMLNATKDEDFDVRSTALEALSTLVKKYPDLARQALQSIQADLQHKHKHVRKDAHKTLYTLIEKSSSLTPKAFLSIREALQQSRQDGDPDVLKASVKALSAVIQAFPDLTNTTLPSLQESVEDANFDGRRATLATISTLVKASPALAQEALLSMLEALEDENADVRQAALEAIVTVIQTASTLTQTALPSLLSSLEHVLKDQDVALRQAALKALVTLINVSKQVQTALPSTQPDSQDQLSDGSSNALLQACTSSSKDQILKNILAAAKDANSDVRSAALQALSTGIHAYPALASHPEIYQFLQNTIQDETDYVRTASLEVLYLLLQSSPEQILKMLPNLVAAIKEKHCKACQATSDLLDSLHQALLRNESVDLPIISAALKDKNFGIRRACLQALSSWIQSSPALAQKTWEDMMKATQDENSGIRKAALQALCSVIESSAALAQKTWQSMMKATQDENFEVLQAALKALCTWINTLPDQIQKTWRSMMEVTEHSDPKALQDALEALSSWITLPDQVQAVLISILRATKHKHTAVREAALKTLSILLQASPSQSQRALPNILAATKDINAAVREAALQALYTVINISSDQVQKVLPGILKATKDKNLNVRKAALGLLLQVATEQLLAYYWPTLDTKIIPYIVPRLAHNSLVVGEARDGLQLVRLYTASGQALAWMQQPEAVKCFRGHFQNEVDKLNRMYSGLLTRVDASVWEHYFGAVGNEPRLPDDLEIIMNDPCPFWPDQQVRDTHWLVLIPSHVQGKPLTLDYLQQLIKRPKNGYATEYSGYLEEVRKTIGNTSPDSSDWVLVTRAMLPESIGKSYQDQCALVGQYPGYAVSSALEALVVMVMHHVRDGEHLDSVKAKCADCYDQQHPVVVQGSPCQRNIRSNGPCIGASLVPINTPERHYGVLACRRL